MLAYRWVLYILSIRTTYDIMISCMRKQFIYNLYFLCLQPLLLSSLYRRSLSY